MTWLDLFIKGWRRRSAMMLDAAGCPVWLVRLRCPVRPGWGALLDELVRRIEGGR